MPRKAFFPPLIMVLGVGTAPWMGEAALHGCCKPRRGGSEGPRAPRRQLGYFFCLFVPSTKTTFSGPSWAAAVCRLLLLCSV